MADNERDHLWPATLASTLTGGSAWQHHEDRGHVRFYQPSYTPDAGTYSASVTFTPNDLINYNTVVSNVNVAVAQASPG